MSGHVLLIDDDPNICDLICLRLTHEGFEVSLKSNADDALSAVLGGAFDAILTDLRLPGMGGVELCARIRELRPDLPVIVITAHGTMSDAIDALRAGASDFIQKPIELSQLTLTIQRTIAHRRLLEEVKRLRQIVAELQSDEIVGTSEVMKLLKRQIQRVASTDATVLITGESGTGKELAARALHREGPRRDRPLVCVNCGGLSDQLADGELFGHVPGAFTGARQGRPGLFLEAQGGTLFLDEVAELSPSLQVKLLRVLQDRRIRPVGSSQEIQVDVRVVAATNRDLESLVETGRFREDLYFRLNVISIELPPLRARGNDVLVLAQMFLQGLARETGKTVTGFSTAAAGKLVAYGWPGNVRELRSCIERAVALTQHERLLVEDLPQRVQALSPTPIPTFADDPQSLPTLREVQDRYVDHVLGLLGGNKSMAARLLGVDRKTLSRKLSQRRDEPGLSVAID